MKQDSHDNERKKISLKDIPKRNFQQVPEGYFENLTEEIQTKAADSKKETPVFSIGLNWQTAAIAASISLILVFSGVFNTTTTPTVDDILAEVSTEEIMEYLDYADFTTYELVTALDIDESEIDDFIDNDIYILDENEFESLDATDLYNEYGIEEQVF